MRQSTPSPVFIGFSSQKGGVGKSTLAEVVSSILYYEKGINLFVMDCDKTQDSFFRLRDREKECIGDSPALTRYMRDYFNRHKRVAYRIHKASPEEAVEKAEAVIRGNKDGGYQAVIFDFPGHAGTLELLELSLKMDYLISPIEADVQSLVSCLAYARSIQDMGVSMSEARVREMMLVWNKVDRRVRNSIIEHYSRHIEEQGLTLLPCRIYSAHRFSHELAAYGAKGVFRSTYLPPVKALREGTGIDEFVAELLSRINIRTNDSQDGDD